MYITMIKLKYLRLKLLVWFSKKIRNKEKKGMREWKISVFNVLKRHNLLQSTNLKIALMTLEECLIIFAFIHVRACFFDHWKSIPCSCYTADPTCHKTYTNVGRNLINFSDSKSQASFLVQCKGYQWLHGKWFTMWL